MLRLWILIAGLLWALPGHAQSFENCNRVDMKVAGAAILGAVDLAAQAATMVGDTQEYGAWFGTWSEESGAEVRENFKAIHVMLVQEDVKAVCIGPQDLDCKDGTFAWVQYDRPGVVHLCPSFFRMPTMADARAGRGDIENGTREGTIIHELSHFPFLAGTGDECYGRSTCGNLARTDPTRAIQTADSYQYFSEDVMLTFWRSMP
jgi:peptidyl-Lys metalloendopeptidase